MSARILVVDDEPAILSGVSYLLAHGGFDVATAGSAEQGLEQARSREFDLVVLDVGLPDLSGIEFCRTLRAESIVPILMLTAKDSEADLALGLEVGADDYVTKPFSTVELLGRIRAILRRRELDRRREGSVRRIGDITIDLDRHELRRGGEQVVLTPSEFKLLALLSGEPGRVFSRREIMEHLWHSPHVGDQRACEGHISALRHKLESDPANPKRILTVRGIGYKLSDA